MDRRNFLKTGFGSALFGAAAAIGVKIIDESKEEPVEDAVEDVPESGFGVPETDPNGYVLVDNEMFMINKTQDTLYVFNVETGHGRVIASNA